MTASPSPTDRLRRALADASVPCGDCHHCCRNNAIMLMPDEGDDVSSFEHEYIDIPGAGPVPFLKRKPNDDCIYLGADGCTIHGRAPLVCRVFDCRRWFLNHTRVERRRMIAKGLASKEVFDAGRARAHTLFEALDLADQALGESHG